MSPKDATLRIVLVEDNDLDADLLLHELSRLGYRVSHQRVETGPELRKALQADCDLIVSDYNLPQFSALDALTVRAECASEVPFIIVSGDIGEDGAVETMKAGAHDYVMKKNLSRLVPALDRELREAEVRRARNKAERELRENEARFRAIASNIPGTVYQFMRRADGAGCPRAGGACLEGEEPLPRHDVA